MTSKRTRAITAVSGAIQGRERSFPRYRGWLKAVSGSVYVSGRPGYVYVQRRNVGDSVQLEEVRMSDVNVPDVDGFPIIVGRNSVFRTEDTVLSRDIDVEVSWIYDYMVTSHREQHQADGFDTVYIYARAHIPLRVSPKADANLTVDINAGMYSSLVGNVYFEGEDDYDLSAYVPDFDQRWVLLGLNEETGARWAIPGELVAIGTPLTIADIPTIPDDMVTLGAVQVYRTQTAIEEEHIFDMRVVSGGWAGTLEVWEEGVLVVDAARVLNFTGDGVTVSELTTGHANIYIPGSTGTSLTVQEDNVTRVDGCTIIDFSGGGVSVVGVGTEAIVYIPGISAATITADHVIMPYLDGATYDTLEDWWNHTQSAGRISGGAITDAYPLINVAAGTGFVKSTDSHTGDTYYFDWPLVNGLNPAAGKNWVYVDYAGGVPTVKVTATKSDINRNTTFTIARLWDTGADFHIIDQGQNAYNVSMRTHRNLVEVFHYQRGGDGLIISESGPADRSVAMSEGYIYRGLNETLEAAIDTDPAGADDPFTAIYSDGDVGWTEVPNQHVVSNSQYDDGSGALQNLSPNHYGVYWVWLHFDDHLYIQYGEGNYRLAQAEVASVPETPAYVNKFGLLIARIIVLQGAASFHSVSFPWENGFEFADISDHGNLGGLLDNDHPWYQGMRYVSLLRAGEITEHADPDDAFVAADTADDVILVPPGTWALSDDHNVAADVSVFGLGSPEDCILSGAELTMAVGSGVIENVTVTISEAKNGSLTSIALTAGTLARNCIAITTNSQAGTGIAYAITIIGGGEAVHCRGYAYGNVANQGIRISGATIKDCYGYAESTGGAGGLRGIAIYENVNYLFTCRGVAGATSGNSYGLLQESTATPYVVGGSYTGDDQDIQVDGGNTINLYGVEGTAGGAGTIVHLDGDRAGKDADETIPGAWTFADDLTASGHIIMDGAAKTLKGSGSNYPDLGTTTEAEKIGQVYLGLGSDVFADGEIVEQGGLMRRFVNKMGIDEYDHHRGTGAVIPAGCTTTVNPTTLWTAWLAPYWGWAGGTYYGHYPNHATLPAGLTIHSADPIDDNTYLTARVHTTGNSYFGVWVDNYDADRDYAIGEYIYRYDVYLYGNGPETLIYTQTATSICTGGGVGPAATFAAWVNHAVSGPYGPFCPCGDGIVLRLKANHEGTAACYPYVMGEQGAVSGLGATQTLYDDVWPGSSPYLARRIGTFHRGQGYAWASWDWFKVS